MTATTDLRAALRDAADTFDMLANRSDASDYHPLVIPTKYHDAARHFRALADASPTVAELLPRVDATHRVRWLIDGNHREAWAGDEDGIIQVSVLGADDRHAQYSDLQVADLTRRGRLVEVAP